jgi:multimeric flavodoxin WrbA
MCGWREKGKTMKISVFYGSIHKKRGNTYVIIKEFVESAREAGADVEVILLAEKKIHHCMACLKCWTRTPGRCALRDDTAGLLETFMNSDLVVWATPVYNHNVTGIMKTFLDRLTPIMDPHLVKMENGTTGHIKKHDAYPRFGVIATGGFPNQTCCEFVSRYFHRLAVDLYSEVVFEIHRGQAILLKMDDASPVGALLDAYKQTVRKAAKEVVQNGKITESTAEELDKPFLPEDFYIEQANRYWDSRIEHYEGALKP